MERQTAPVSEQKTEPEHRQAQSKKLDKLSEKERSPQSISLSLNVKDFEPNATYDLRTEDGGLYSGH